MRCLLVVYIIVGLDHMLRVEIKQVRIIHITILVIVISFSSVIGTSNGIKLDYDTQSNPFVLKWNVTYTDLYDWVNPPGMGDDKWAWSGNCMPLAANVLGDSTYELFIGIGEPSNNWATGERGGAVVCVNGTNGLQIWNYTSENISDRCYMELYDVDQDDDLELLFASLCEFGCMDAATGTMVWNVTSTYPNPEDPGASDHRMDKPFAVLNINGTVYVYHPQDGLNDAVDGLIWKRYATNGTIVANNTTPEYPCHGGISAEDLDQDGDIEIILNDRNYGGAVGVQVYDQDLNFEDSYAILCSSHVSHIVDIDNDGDFEIITFNQGSTAGMYTNNYSNGNMDLYPGKFTANIGSGYHQWNSVVYDFDGDGWVEIVIGNEYDTTPMQVWNMSSFSLNTTFSDPDDTEYDRPPIVANLNDSTDGMELFCADGDTHSEIWAYNKTNYTYYMVGETPNSLSFGNYLDGWGIVVQDIDRDGLNEIFVVRSVASGQVTSLHCYETQGTTPTPEQRTVNYLYSLRRLGVAEYVPPPDLAPQEDEIQFISINEGINGTIVYVSNPTFNWTLISDSSQYNLQIANDSDFSQLVVNITNITEVTFSSYYGENTTRVSFTLPPSHILTELKTYYCRVRSYTKD